jgi:glycosyltransferase involved in cell wall biosynthesis
MVSVALVAFNHKQYINQSLESILAQETNFPYEIVISDDCSTDGTTDILRDYQVRYPKKIRLILAKRNLWKALPDMATSPTCNIAILGACRGKYIAICEGDDYWTDPLKLQKQVDFLEMHPKYSGAFHQTQLLEEDSTWGDPLRWWQDLGERLDITFEDTISTRPPFHTSSFLFRRDRLSLPKDFSRYVSGDMALFVILSSQGNFRRIPEYMSVYRKHPGGITETSAHKDVVRLLLNRLYLFTSLRNYLYPQGYENFNLLIDSMYESLAIILLDRTNIKNLPKYVSIILKCTSISLRTKILTKMAIFFIAQTLNYFIFRIKCLVPRRLKDSIRYLIGNYQQDIR